ncbi:hypothetical protein J2X20_003803 [Pelomonas saccharophila]|uniref:PEP-CTERM protein-sorting domain-containing protein n=1 Tax=Roseateles saccharophilus TaxID=304 RepID=A0ABU1YSC1_ROSSA|nr:PEP-CTERM sorting domain-containing protein [Roseateles saccharophilus]MDR7271145.1 hypothetical protein [Roseateles saccharophilus]
MNRLLALALVTSMASLASPALAADPIKILFVGNSYTFGRVDPVMSYNAAAVHDLTAGFSAINPTGTNSYPAGTVGFGSFEPHPWGGVPGIFKKMTDEAGLAYDVSLSTRNAASLRGQFLDTANSDWKLRENVATQKWDSVVLQEQSDAALPAGKGKNANLATFNAYADQFERFIHNGAAQSYKESTLFGSLANCMATGLSSGSCNTTRNIAANSNASANTRIYLEQSWARPDMVEAHKITTPDLTSADGRPIVDISAAGGNATLYYNSLADMTADLHASFYAKAASNPGFAGVVPVGDAFQRAVDQGLAQGSGFYNAGGTFAETAGALNLWWLDRTHASKYGSYLSALTLFGSITGRDPLSLGVGEQAAIDLGIDATTARSLQRVASLQLGFTAAVPEPQSLALLLAGLGVIALRTGKRRDGAPVR